MSCFNINIKISDSDCATLKSIPCVTDFPIHLLETRSGEPNRDTGIPPAFFTAKWTMALGKPISLDLEIARPTKILFSMARWNYLLAIQEMVMYNLYSTLEESKLRLNLSDKVTSVSSSLREFHNVGIAPSLPYNQQHGYTKFSEIKKHLHGVRNLSVKLAQTVLVFKTSRGNNNYLFIN